MQYCLRKSAGLYERKEIRHNGLALVNQTCPQLCRPLSLVSDQLSLLLFPALDSFNERPCAIFKAHPSHYSLAMTFAELAILFKGPRA